MHILNMYSAHPQQTHMQIEGDEMISRELLA